MNLRKIYEGSDAVQPIVNLREYSQFKGIAVKFEGTADTAQTLVKEDFGRIRYEKRGATLVDAHLDMLWHLRSLLGGTSEFASATAGAIDFWVYIPRRFGDNNVETVTPADNASIIINVGTNFNTAVASGTWQIYLDTEVGVQEYDMVIKQYTESYGGAGTYPITIEQDNILLSCIGLRSSGALITIGGSAVAELSTEVGDVQGHADTNALVWNTQDQLLHESATDPYVLVNFFAHGDINSRLADKINMNMRVTGAAQPEILLLSSAFDVDRLEKTIDVQAGKFNIINTRKVQQGKSQSVAAVRRITAAAK